MDITSMYRMLKKNGFPSPQKKVKVVKRMTEKQNHFKPNNRNAQFCKLNFKGLKQKNAKQILVRKFIFAMENKF